MAARRKEGYYYNKVSIYFLTIGVVGVSRDTVFQEIRQGAGFESGDFVKEKFGELP